MRHCIERRPAVFLLGCCALLTILWLPGLRYPVVSDTVNYAKLGLSILENGTYALNGVPYAAHLPLHAILSIPFTLLFGVNLGMHLLTLVGGWATLVCTFLLLRRCADTTVAALATAFVLLHPGFILMSMLGSADLTFTALLLAALWMYVSAAADPRRYLGMGIALGLLCLTRYNGVPFFPLLFLWTVFARRSHRTSGWMWGGFLLGAVIASLWFLRNLSVFGDPLHTVYAGELAKESDGPLLQIWSNILYYGNPLHNVFVLLPFALAGIVLYARRQTFLLVAMLCAWMLTAVWWVQAIRFAFPGYPILLGFAAMGFLDIRRRVHASRSPGWLLLGGIYSMIVAMLVLAHLSLICAYTYGACNALIDRHTNVIPKNLGLTPEGFEAWAQAKDWVNANAPQGAVIAAPGASFELLPREKVFRADLTIVEPNAVCPATYITQHPQPGDTIFFTTKDAPATSVAIRPCP